MGLINGNCMMRGTEYQREMSANYGTCTYNISTCPDTVCDELEELEPLLCPQDCTSKLYIVRVHVAVSSRLRGIRVRAQREPMAFKLPNIRRLGKNRLDTFSSTCFRVSYICRCSEFTYLPKFIVLISWCVYTL